MCLQTAYAQLLTEKELKKATKFSWEKAQGTTPEKVLKLKLKEEGLKFIYADETDDEVTHIYYGNKRYPKTSKLFPGDVIKIVRPHNRRQHDMLARVVHVRNFQDYSISCTIFEGDYAGMKEILTVDEYTVVRRNDGTLPNDMKRVRTDIVKEDDDNIDKI